MKQFYPDFVPRNRTYIKNQLKGSFHRGATPFFKDVLTLLSRVILPRCIAKILAPLFLLSKNKTFLRLNMDHFGPVVYLYAFINSDSYKKNRDYFVICYDFPNKSLLQLFPKNIKFIEGVFNSFLFGWMFFLSKYSIHIFPLFEDLEENRELCGKFDWSQLTRSPKGLCGLVPQSSGRPEWLRDQIGEKKYFVIFNREPGCSYTVGASRRNMELARLRPIIELLRLNGYEVIRYGDSYVKSALDQGFSDKDLFDYSNSRFNSKMNDIALWSHCEGVIGNASGATHVPSILFGKPTLYIGFSWLKGLAMWHGLHFHNGCIPSENYWLVSSAFHEGVWVEPNERLNAETTTNEDIFNKYSITDLSPETLLQGAQIFLSEQFENIDKKSTNFNLIKRFDLFSMPEGKGTPFKPLYRESGDGRVLISRV